MFVTLAVRDAEKALRRRTLWQKLLTKLNQPCFQCYDVMFPLSGFEQSAEEICALFSFHLGGN
jgi:hypothetical protein